MMQMTANEARAVVSKLVAETPKPTRVRLMQLSLKLGNLSEEAKGIYRDQLALDGVA